MNVPARLLIADDQHDVVEALRLLLKGEDFEIETVSSPGGVVAALEARDFDVLLADLNYTRDTTSGREGLGLLASIHAVDPTLPVVVMTAWGSVGLAVEAMRLGARDFVQKPWENERLLQILKTQAELSRTIRRGERLALENRLLREGGRPDLLAESKAMRPALELIARVGPSDANVLITGENGSGKGAVARALHAASRANNQPLVTVNVGGLPEGVFESELFGHVRGAFTDAKSDRVGRFELADGGTLFLDEIAELPLSLQPKLLRVVETGEFERVGSSRTRRVSVRIFSATNSDVRADLASGRLRQDLFFRLNTVEIPIPPLRDRYEDIPLLAHLFLSRHASKTRKAVTGFEPEAVQAMLAYRWPGNVRELDHSVERGVLMAAGEKIRVADLGLRTAYGPGPTLDDMSLEDVEAHLIRKALARFGNNVSLAANALGLSRGALYRRLERYGISAVGGARPPLPLPPR